MSRISILAALLAATALALATRPALAREAARALRAFALPLALAGAALLGLLALAPARGPAMPDGVDRALYLRREVLAATASFAMLWIVALRLPAGSAALARGLLRMPPAGWALLVFAASLAAHWLVFDAIGHTSDEAAYLFQARTLAHGRLAFPVPAHSEFFGFVHIREAGGSWHGIMNPGWPAMLSLGVRLGVPGAVNPLLAALTVPLLVGALRRAGASEAAARLVGVGLAISPFFVFLAGTLLSHTANLFLLALFVHAFVRMRAARGGAALVQAAIAGAALALGATVRPLDTAVAALPFGAWQLIEALREPRRVPALLLTGALAGCGVAALLAYDSALTGDPLRLPMQAHFEEQMPGQRFGMGFGDDMGTKLHGAQWPGFHPSDAPLVSAHRLVQWLDDVYGLPLVWLAALLAACRAGPVPGAALRRALAASALGLIAVYAAHFYHGIAYGARHYALALPGAVAFVALPLARHIEQRGPHAPALQAALAALVVHVLLIATPPLVRTYAHDYRMASGVLRDAVAERRLDRALVFVSPERWGWKSAFPLNALPLDSNAVLFARDLGEHNAILRRALPERRAYRARILADGSAQIVPYDEEMPLPPPQPPRAR